MELAAQRGFPDKCIPMMGQFELDEQLDKLIHEGKAMFGQDALHMPKVADMIHEKDGLRALAILPVLHEGQAVAVITLASYKFDEFPMSTRTALETIATQVGGTLGRIRIESERLQAEEALKKSEERFRTLVESMDDIVFTLDTEQRHTGVFGNWVTREGMTSEIFLGKTAADVLGLEAADIHVQSNKRALAGEHVVYNWSREDSSGVRYFQTSLSPIQDADGYIVGVVGVGRDVSKLAKVEEERRRLLVQVREIMNGVPEGVLLLDADGQVVLNNPVAAEALVLLTGSQTGRKLTQLGDRSLAQLLTSPPRGLWHEVHANEHTFEVIARPVTGGSKTERWVMVLRDVTQEREIQQGVQRQERLAAVGQLAAGIAHDFNNILAVIVLYTELTILYYQGTWGRDRVGFIPGLWDRQTARGAC